MEQAVLSIEEVSMWLLDFGLGPSLRTNVCVSEYLVRALPVVHSRTRQQKPLRVLHFSYAGDPTSDLVAKVDPEDVW